ncbi:ATP-binding protein [Salinisphaera sp. LB1]|uniref:ATP-binding protein n=1 Tax=Salinisphaera sp. LB1 TaxID=2183911 RepID=UPI000D706032|nr:ATP-binding protein [Salinisphaera sp. LB1]AWN14814.1 Sensor histidine kinase [Salinisphaera sp. LB1]
MKRWRPRGLAARIIVLTLLALVISQCVSYLSFRSGRQGFIEHMISDYMSQSVISVDHSLRYAKPGHEGDLVRSLSSRPVHFDLVRRPPHCAAHNADSRRYARDFAERLNVSLSRVRVCVGRGLMHSQHGPGRMAVELAFRRDDGRWLDVRQRLPGQIEHWAQASLRNLLITLALMSVAVIFASRRITRPLLDLASAAERYGRGERIRPIRERGSDEIKRTIVEFNRMHERIDRFVAERTRLVAALAHDLRTPITALRLRLEFLPDDDNTRAMNATLADMAHMSEAALTFMREEASAEATRRMDLTALVDAVAEDYRAADAPVRFEPGAPIPLVCRPVAIRRALRNVIDNALAYGEIAELALADSGQQVVIEVADRGPGIGEAEMDKVFDAFVRLETSRNRETGGVGLGLSIARSVIRAHGGDITLANRPEGGLVVRMTLPRARM